MAISVKAEITFSKIDIDIDRESMADLNVIATAHGLAHGLSANVGAKLVASIGAAIEKRDDMPMMSEADRAALAQNISAAIAGSIYDRVSVPIVHALRASKKATATPRQPAPSKAVQVKPDGVRVRSTR
jgi:hypothetical protein